MLKIAPSILAADFAGLGDEIRSVSSADYIHFDVMDGVFVPNISFGIPVLESVRAVTDMVLDVHLMITEPVRYVRRFAMAGADIITVHLEADSDENIADAVRAVRDLGKKAGIAIKPGTPCERLFPYLDGLDMALIMTVEPGFGGQGFMDETLPKIARVRGEILRRGLSCDVEVDGGINVATAKRCVDAGANVLVAGSSVFGAVDRDGAIMKLRLKS